ncbi:phytoene desaturase family protein [Chondrinema litorale]|uniref:phytoene desaturase family protein n=1 Tax=Chondrinema litorale TaxID=2994555 RepID=UPI0025438E14|nr:phytoene desaturase family protein [Chondrinema litorale]UZR95585.1 phytoene desaturase family protein [Chondrinema litorale]
MKKNIIVIGAGFAGLSAAISLADKGFSVKILEKNSVTGGRARYFKEQGFTFDMGPSWYWMPDVFESFFNRFGKKTSDYYELVRLDPSYRVFFGKDDFLDIPAEMQAINQLFESLEPGSSTQLQEFLKQAAYKYEVGINNLVYKPGQSVMEFMDVKLLSDVIKMDIFQSFSKHVRKFFKNDKLIRLIEFPILFLGATPENTPALYSLMNYADIALGTWYPKGGMHKIIEAMVALAKEKGVEIITGEEVKVFDIDQKDITKVITENTEFEADVVVAGADYHHIDKQVLPADFSNYTESYWDKRVMAPSSLIFYVGLNKKLNKLIHHNLFFDRDLGPHAVEIYENPKWPTEPLFYVSVTSKTDETVAEEGMENVFILMPVAPDLEDNEEIREKYFNIIVDRIENITGEKFREHIIYTRSYAHKDFKKDYHAFKGNAYGLANTLMQTAILKPGLKNKKLNNLYYTGQLTVPGPGVPPSLISGIVVADEVEKQFS